ncbi:unnamed protein product [Urochloa humidicola]
MYSSVSAPGCFSRTPLKSPTSARGGAPAISIPVVSGGRSVAVLSELDPHRPRRPDKGSEATVGGLPDDALEGILSRLPAKPVCRFKCVSKAWCGLIADRLCCRKFPQTLAGFFDGGGRGGLQTGMTHRDILFATPVQSSG